MGLSNTFSYRQIFDEDRPKEPQELLREIPSRIVIAILATFNDILSIKGRNQKTQLFLLKSISVNFPDALRNQIFANAIPRISSDYELFASPFTVEFINRELINFREDTGQEIRRENELNIFKAYVAIMDELVEKQTEALAEVAEEAKKGGENIRKLLWTHIIKQYEFTNRPDPVTEVFKSRALISYIDHHPKFGEPARELFATFNCNSGHDYINKLFGIIFPHLSREETEDPGKYFFRIRFDEPEPVIENLTLDPAEIANNKELQTDYLGLKKKPIFRFEGNEYIVPYWDYMYTSIATGLLYFLYENSTIKQRFLDKGNTDEEGFRKFKGAISKEFSEGVLFQNTMRMCFGRKKDCVLFFRDEEQFNPDCYYRHGRHIFIFEFKDHLLNSEVIQFGSYEDIKNEIDEKFVQATFEKNGKTVKKDKGVFQLARNIEILTKNEELFWEIDKEALRNKLRLRDMAIYPIVVQTNLYFDMPDIAEYLNKIIQERLQPIKNSMQIQEFRMIDFKYFREKILMFADSKLELHKEIRYYKTEIDELKKKFEQTGDLNFWFDSMTPFSFVQSPGFLKYWGYRRSDAVKFLNQCWLIDS